MNQQQIICETLLGKFHRDVVLGSRTFSIHQPTIKDLCRILGKDTVPLHEQITKIEVMAKMKDNLHHSADIISKAIFKNEAQCNFLKAYIKKFATLEQISNAMTIFFEVVNGKDLFENIKIDKVRSDDENSIIGGHSLLGIITLFQENLKLSFTEVFDKITYPTLLVMNADKLRSLPHGQQIVNRVSGREMMERRKQIKNG